MMWSYLMYQQTIPPGLQMGVAVTPTGLMTAEDPSPVATGTETGYGTGLGQPKARKSSTKSQMYPMINIAKVYLRTAVPQNPLSPFQKRTEPTMSQASLQMMKKTWSPSHHPQVQASSGEHQAMIPRRKKITMNPRMMYPSTWNHWLRDILIPLARGGGSRSTQVLSLQAQQRLQTRKGKNMMKKQRAYQKRKVFHGQQLGLTPPQTVDPANILFIIEIRLATAFKAKISLNNIQTKDRTEKQRASLELIHGWEQETGKKMGANSPRCQWNRIEQRVLGGKGIHG